MAPLSVAGALSGQQPAMVKNRPSRTSWLLWYRKFQCSSELEKAARDACGHFAQNHSLLRTFGAFCRDFEAGIEDKQFKIEEEDRGSIEDDD